MSRYNKTKTYRRRGEQFYGTTKYISPPLSSQDLYVITQEGDSFDSLAQQYYGDSSLWYIISSSNPNLKQNSYYPPIGIQIRIPGNVTSIINNNAILNER